MCGCGNENAGDMKITLKLGGENSNISLALKPATWASVAGTAHQCSTWQPPRTGIYLKAHSLTGQMVDGS